MQNEDVGRVHEEGKTKPGLNPGLRSASDKKLDSGYLLDEPSQHREDRRRWFFVLAFVESIDHDDCRNTR